MKKKKLKKIILEKIKKEEIKMKPKLYFVLGSFFSFLALIGVFLSASFLFNLLFFILRPHYGPNYYWRLDLILKNIPYWILILTLFFIFLGIFFLKKYDFSYKKNFFLIVLIFILSIIFAGFLMEKLGINDLFIRKGPRQMRRFYQQFDGFHQQRKMFFRR